MAAVTVSTNLDEQDASKVRQLAKNESRTVSNFVANAVVVFSDMPKDLRDSLLELRAADDQALIRATFREMAALVARRKFELASHRLAGRDLLPSLPADASDTDFLETATALSAGR